MGQDAGEFSVQTGTHVSNKLSQFWPDPAARPTPPSNLERSLFRSLLAFAMPNVGRIISLPAALLSHSWAHFLLNYPPTIGFDDDLEGTAPCGSYNVKLFRR